MDPVVGGVIATVAGGLILYFIFGIGRSKKEPPTVSANQTQHVSQTVTVVNGEEKPKNSSLSNATSSRVEVMKKDVSILFIDDRDLSKKIENLKEAGWQKVQQIKDAPNIDIPEIRGADIIFVDYKGVAKSNPEEQGLSIVKALKARYGENKYLILYSAHSVPLNAFSCGADAYLQKNSTIYELEQKIIEGGARS